MIICPACQAAELEGALFCANCGARLVLTDLPSQQTATYPESLKERSELENPLPAQPVQPAPDFLSRVAVQIISTGDQIPLRGNGEFTLGRVSGNQPVLPDIDLTQYQAYESGVSRLHATLRLEGETAVITDLGSANGTRLNGQRIPAHDPQPLQDGDIISLGNFKVSILIRGH